MRPSPHFAFEISSRSSRPVRGETRRNTLIFFFLSEEVSVALALRSGRARLLRAARTETPIGVRGPSRREAPQSGVLFEPSVAGATPPFAGLSGGETGTSSFGPHFLRSSRTTSRPSGFKVFFYDAVPLREGPTVMILPQVHLRKPCYDFYFL